jgi:hypothetical protein
MIISMEIAVSSISNKILQLHLVQEKKTSTIVIFYFFNFQASGGVNVCFVTMCNQVPLIWFLFILTSSLGRIRECCLVLFFYVGTYRQIF